ncbi:MAG: RNA polymerase sigma-70 factor [Opitutaceae bacterium]
MTADRLKTFAEHRRHLFGVAYRMLGSVADAEDMTQEALVRWHRSGDAEIVSPKAWLTTVVTRLCINHLTSARVQRETYFGTWLPEPLVAEAAPTPDQDARLADSLSLAVLVLLESLAPPERAVFLLREVFDYEFSEIAEIAEIVGKTEANCRQILVRAREQVAARRPRFESSPEKCEQVLPRFFRAAKGGDIPGLLAVVADDVTMTTDGGGHVRAVARPVVGADHVTRFVAGSIRKFVPEDREFRPAQINGLPGLLGLEAGRVVQVLAFAITDDRIHAIYLINNPEKLRHLNLQAPRSFC